MKCSNCGFEQKDGRFCESCGADLYAAQQTYTAPAEPAKPAQNMGSVTLGQWIGVFFLSLVPVLNLIFMIIWACSSRVKKSLRTYAGAQLILMGIVLVIMLILLIAGVSIGGLFANLM